ncbi:hypothetical protein [Halorubrum laminariae]|uniref:NrS-1 polymerase-like HBD domain-containing protein n=1 Tax=Halorubrum laminariae TaxID=1433523 RepID=A0ABD6BXT3_9EURY|nr:hypothetical protein [Halorubrum laminariae]
MSAKQQESTDTTHRSDLNITEESNENNLLEDLKTRPQWVCWKFEERNDKTTKIPVDPHTGQYASSSDPDTWGTFDLVREHNQSNPETDGIGVVFGDDDFIAGIDLDNVRDPDTGALEPWAQDVIDALDSYTEISPSGTGVHILLYGMLPSDGRTRAHQESTLEPFDTSEIEMYDSGRFFTVTFDHITSTPTDLNHRKNALVDIHNEYLAQDDTNGQNTTTEATTEELDLSDQELIETAKNAGNGRDFERLWNGDTSAYDGDHSRADMGLLSHLAFWTQKDATRMERLFGQSGLVRDKWTDRSDYRDRSIQKAIRNCSEVYEPADSEESQDGVSDSSTDTTDDDELTQIDANTDIVARNGAYCQPQQRDDGSIVYNPITTFTLSAQAFVVDEHGDEYADIRVHPQSEAEEPYDVVVPWTAFNEPRKLKEEIVIGRTTTFEGQSHHINDLRKIVSHQDAPHLQKTDKLGIHGDEIVTADGVLGTDNPSHRYVQSNTNFEQMFKLSDVGIDDDEESEVAELLELLPKTRNKERLLPILGYWYASLFTPQIREWEGEVPFLGISAETGSGKSSLFELLNEMIGVKGEPLSVKASQFALKNHFSGATNIPLWLDEYKPSDMPDWKINNLHDYIRKSTRGGIETAGSRTHTGTESWHFGGPIVVSGEQTVKGNAESRRQIEVKILKESVRDDTYWTQIDGGDTHEDGETIHHDALDVSIHARAIWQYIIDSDDDDLQQHWSSAKEHAHEIANQAGVENIEELEIIQLTMVHFGIAVYRHFATTVGADPDITEDEIDNALLYIADATGSGNRESHVDELLRILSEAARKEDAKWETDYAVINAGKSNEQLCIKLAQAHSTVRKYIRDHDIASDVFNDAKDYKHRLKELEDDSESYVLNTSKVHRDLNRCVAIDMEMATEEIDGFDEQAFVR